MTSDLPLRAYALRDDSCLSTAAPSGTSKIVTSDGCHWEYRADIICSSQKHYIPTETATHRNGPATITLNADYEASLWYDREYVAGKNGEAAPIRIQDHNDYREEGGVLQGCQLLPCHHIIIAAAPGESFSDRLTPSGPLSGYDQTNGVAIRNDLPHVALNRPAGLTIHDNLVDLVELQVKSIHDAAVDAMSTFGNKITIRNCILDGGSQEQWTVQAALATDTSSVIANSLIISHAQIGVAMKYPGFVLHSTIVNPDRVPGSVGVETLAKWVFNDSTVANTAIFGFAHGVAHGKNTSWSPKSSHNATDAPSDDAGTGPWPYGETTPAIVSVLPGTTYNVSPNTVVMNFGGDWRLSPNSPLRATGGAFGSFSVNCSSREPNCLQRTTYPLDTPDMIGTPRPQAGRYDIGAWQSCAFAALGSGSRC